MPRRRGFNQVYVFDPSVLHGLEGRFVKVRVQGPTGKESIIIGELLEANRMSCKNKLRLWLSLNSERIVKFKNITGLYVFVHGCEVEPLMRQS